MDLNASCSSLNMNCLLVCPDYFLYYNVPKEICPKRIIQILIWTIFLTFFCWRVCLQLQTTRRRRPANQNKQQMSEKKELKLKVKYKSWERFFSKMVRLNVIQNSTKNIFCLKSEHWHSSPCYPTLQAVLYW